ncbi:hypothetical protein [Pseudothermotoga sp.]|uniref:hypothetical protein n=1 Tax=Pseudothermotoga sp. TaxID=2033661 RepID=UPI0031F6F1DD
MKKLILFFVSISLILLLFACAQQPQEQKPTFDKLVQELVSALQNFVTTSPTALDGYVKTFSSEQAVLTAKSNLLTQLRFTLSSLGNQVQLLSVYETKSATPIYSFDLGLKPDVVDKVYLTNLLLINQAQQKKSIYSLPIITLKNEANKIYIAVIFERDGSVTVYPKPITP